MNLRNLLGPYRGLPEPVYVLFLANVVNSLGNFVWPLLALLLTDKLGMSKAEAGYFVMLSAVAYVPGSLLGGKIADHVGRKKALLLSRFLAALVLVPCAFLEKSPLIPWLVIANSFFNGTTDPAIASTVTDLTNSRTRQAAFSLQYLGHNIGVALGLMMAGFLYNNYLPWIFLGDALTTFLSLILIAVYVQETLPDRKAIEEGQFELTANERAEEGSLVAALLRRPLLLVFSLGLMAYSFVYVQSGFSLPLQLQEIFGRDGAKRFGLLMSVNAVTVVTLTALVVRLTSRFLPAWNIGVGGLLYALGFGMIYLVHGMSLLVVSTLIWTLGEILVTTNSQVYLANNTPVSHRGRFNAVLPLIWGAGHALGPWLMGRFIDRAGVQMVWPVVFVLALAASLPMFGLAAAEKARAGKAALA